MINNFRTRDAYFLSNFFPSSFTVDGIWYGTVEHYFQSQKTNDRVEQIIIRQASTPKEAKLLGKKITLRNDWEDVKLNVMRTGVKAKFNQNTVLKQRLIDTEDEELQEGNYWGDKFWGVDSKTGEGENWLGKILMEIRSEFRRKHECRRRKT